MEIPNTAHNLTCYFTWMGEDGIARTKVKPGSAVKLEHAQENSVAVNSFYVDRKYPLLIDARGIRSITRDARNFFTTNGRQTNTLGFAIIIDSSVSKVIGNFFLGINKPAVPTKLFLDESNVVDWLSKLKE